MRRWRPLISDFQCNLEIALWANHIQVLNEEKSGVSVTEEMVGGTKYVCIVAYSCDGFSTESRVRVSLEAV